MIYTFTVEIEDFNPSPGFIESIKAEVEHDAHLLNCCRAINESSTRLYSTILADFIKPVNEELKKVGLSFGTPLNESSGDNKYHPSISYLAKGDGHNNIIRSSAGMSTNLRIKGKTNAELSDTYGHSTFTGEYVIEFNAGMSSKSVSNIEELYTLLRPIVKDHIKTKN